ncbi:ABC transporter ATP-binding protein [Pseudoclavibacter sp. AY1H1]|uniref:ABC transporter ATP-binding protein n=1 Tax=Pseudoclavibacter sp. AY1H1 TaxID=2080584 RepID=UPI000CE78A21|nr:ABC transporter ATP-binding protein [Pseudoclavibacter sp. AY1H1]PPF34912.1 ABC transporter ATP-binding protein [Pseudoclavibacter sp. AY1H1]
MTGVHSSAKPTTLPIASGKRTARLAWHLLTLRPWMLVLSIALLGAAACAALLVPTGLGRLVDAVTGADHSLLDVALLLIAGIAGSAALGALGSMALAAVLETALARLREDFVSAALSLPPVLVDEIADGELVSRATDDVDTVGEVTTGAVPAVVSAGLAVIATGIGLAVLNPLFLLAMLTVVPVHAFALWRYLRKAPRLYAAERVAVAARSREMVSAIQALPTVHAFGWGKAITERIRTRSWNVLRWSLRTRIVQSRFGFRMNMAEAVGLASVLLVGAWLAFSGSATIGEVTTAALLFQALFGPFIALLMLVDDLQSAGASLARVAGVIQLAPARAGLSAPASAAGAAIAAAVAVAGEPATPDVELRGVVAAYPGRPAVLWIDELRIPAGQRVAIVGSSGAGKSTLARVLMGLLDVREGRVDVAGLDPALMEENERARRVVMVSQDVHVFSGTLRHNLLMARENASDSELHEALESVAGPRWRHTFADGLETLIGEGNAELTATDAHRLALARALVTRASIVILDEATADADTTDARALEAAARRALAGRTVVTVAHHLTQASSAERVLVMEHGRIVEDGTHDELLDSEGPYRELWAAWSSHRSRAPREQRQRAEPSGTTDTERQRP